MMSEWLDAKHCKPPSCLGVLLYVVIYNENTGHFWDDEVITGFYDDESEEWSYIFIDKDGSNHRMLKMNKNIKIIAWTLIPEPPDNPNTIKVKYKERE